MLTRSAYSSTGQTAQSNQMASTIRQRERCRPSLQNSYINDIGDVILIIEGVLCGTVQFISLEMTSSHIQSRKLFTLDNIEAGDVWIMEMPNQGTSSKFQWTDNKLWGRYKNEGCFQICSEIEADLQRARRPLPPTQSAFYKKSVTFDLHSTRKFLVINYYSQTTFEDLVELKNDSRLLESFTNFNLQRNRLDGLTEDRYKIIGAQHEEVLTAVLQIQETIEKEDSSSDLDRTPIQSQSSTPVLSPAVSHIRQIATSNSGIVLSIAEAPHSRSYSAPFNIESYRLRQHVDPNRLAPRLRPTDSTPHFQPSYVTLPRVDNRRGNLLHDSRSSPNLHAYHNDPFNHPLSSTPNLTSNEFSIPSRYPQSAPHSPRLTRYKSFRQNGESRSHHSVNENTSVDGARRSTASSSGRSLRSISPKDKMSMDFLLNGSESSGGEDDHSPNLD